MDKLTQRVKKFARQVGADLVGIAGKDSFDKMPTLRPEDLLPDAQSVVVMAVKRNAHSLSSGATWNGQEHYLGLLAMEMGILFRTASFLDDEGYQTYTVSHHGHLVPRDVSLRAAIKHLKVTKDGELENVAEFCKAYLEGIRALSHMHLAQEAGMGEIGHCKLLITPEYGPRVSLVSLVTDAPLEPDEKLKEPVCIKDECSKCIEYCRSHALTPEGGNMAKCMFQMGSLPPVEAIQNNDQDTIERHLLGARLMMFPAERNVFRKQVLDNKQRPGGCGMCVLACPVGKRTGVKPRQTAGTVSVSRELY